jgi:probable rRNA maturation factor
VTGTDVSRRIHLPPWRVDLTVRDGVERVIAAVELARTVARALDAADAPGPASIGLVLSDDDELADLNATHMGHDGPTDVLSFPLLEPDAFVPGAPPPVVPRPPGSRVHLGDIVVSVERAVEQARTGRGGQTGDVRWSPADELRLLVAHGTLHICGHDHERPDDEAAMRALERRILEPVERSIRPMR